MALGSRKFLSVRKYSLRNYVCAINTTRLISGSCPGRDPAIELESGAAKSDLIGISPHSGCEVLTMRPTITFQRQPRR